MLRKVDGLSCYKHSGLTFDVNEVQNEPNGFALLLVTPDHFLFNCGHIKFVKEGPSFGIYKKYYHCNICRARV